MQSIDNTYFHHIPFKVIPIYRPVFHLVAVGIDRIYRIAQEFRDLGRVDNAETQQRVNAQLSVERARRLYVESLARAQQIVDIVNEGSVDF